MNERELARVAERVACRMVGIESAGGGLHREVLGALGQAFDDADAHVLCEPTLIRSTHRPPDCVVVSPRAGVQVVEVKQVALDQIREIAPGGELHIHYARGLTKKNVVAQVRDAMFDIKDTSQRLYEKELVVPFGYWVAFPQITRQAWLDRWGEEGYCPNEFLFRDDLSLASLARRLEDKSLRLLAVHDLERCPSNQLQVVLRAFGDSTVLFPDRSERVPRKVGEGTLGEAFDEAAESYKTLSDEQQALSIQDWEGGPRLVRGVAGSGKTIVLANNLARRLCRNRGRTGSLYEAESNPPRVLAVCFNRTLAPFLRKKIDIAHRQRTGEGIAAGVADVMCFNALMWHLKTKGLWQYQPVPKGDDGGARSRRYLERLRHAMHQQPDLAALLYDAIYVDEGQDFGEDDYRLLKALCRPGPSGEPNLYVFYDDAQNLYAKPRPNWQSLGINVRGGRSSVMTQCFRNTRPIVERAFNVLYGTCAAAKTKAPRRDFGDLATLTAKGLLIEREGLLHVMFAMREGQPPRLSWTHNGQDEERQILSRLRWLLQEQEVRPEDVAVLTMRKDRATRLAQLIRTAGLPIAGVHLTMTEKDRLLGERGYLSVSTVASAKGYDKYCVLLASAQDFSPDVTGRANFYVGCTRAIEYLELFGTAGAPLMTEFEVASDRLAGIPAGIQKSRDLARADAAESDVLLAFWDRFAQSMVSQEEPAFDEVVIDLARVLLREHGGLTVSAVARILMGSRSQRVAPFHSHGLYGALRGGDVLIRDVRRSLNRAVSEGRLQIRGRVLEDAAAG